MALFRTRSNLALERDAQDRFLPWLVAFMVFLAVLAFAATVAVHDAAGRWDRGARGTVTIQVPASGNAAKDKAALTAVAAILRDSPGIVSVEVLSEERTARLLEPWLGQGGLKDLPVPRLIDVRVDPAAKPDLIQLGGRLAGAAPGTAVDDHHAWLGRLFKLMRALEATAIAVLALVLAVTIAAVIFTTRTGLAIHHEAIEVMHLIGARDSYIAAQFADRALALGLKGALLGLALALPALAVIGSLTGEGGGDVVPRVTFSLLQWLMLAAVPLLVAQAAAITARLTVLRILARMP
ncbi:MAG: cell division protein [Alphaproteobacteria bacterium]|nr:cell division protein [Alphaproteobacteria bacterium]